MRTSRSVSLLGLWLTASLHAASADAQVVQQGGAFVPLAVTGSGIGSAVALSADGNSLVIGAPTYSASNGRVYAYGRRGGAWAYQDLFLGSGAVGAAAQGSAVALSADGATVAVGGPTDSSSAGAVWILTRSGGKFAQQGPKLRGSGGSGASRQGFSVALSADGNTLAIGAPYDAGNVGAVWVFVRSGNSWTQQGSRLTATGEVGAGDLGYSVALSADGNTLLAGAPTDAAGTGAAFVFTRSGSTWTQQGAKLVGTGLTAAPQRGISVALSGDGQTAALGANFDNSGIGATLVFTRSGNAWSQQGSRLVGADAVGGNVWQGISTALSADGNTLIVGGQNDDSFTGAAWVFTRVAGTWSQLGSKLVGSGSPIASQNGISVAISSDGRTLAEGASFASATGAAFVFVRPAPAIVSVSDVPLDQGGHVSIRWTASVLDATPSDSVDAYGIWRQLPATLAAQRQATGSRVRSTVQGAQTYFWEYLGSQPAHGFAAYSYTAPTAFDSTAAGNPRTLFMVETQLDALGLYFPSAPDSGYSVDNLPPATPAPATGAYAAGATQLLWSPNGESDLAGYRVYRGGSPAFTIGPATLVAQVGTATTSYHDAPGTVAIYKLTALDAHGNESAAATIVPAGTAGVEPRVPAALALAAPTPNPASRGARIEFALPHAGRITLAIYDTDGRRVRTLADGERAAGPGVAEWDLRDDAGRRVAPAVYFVRLAAEGRVSTRRLVTLE